MKILIIEDEVKTIDYLKRGLTEQGYSVDAATDWTACTWLRPATMMQSFLTLCCPAWTA